LARAFLVTLFLAGAFFFATFLPGVFFAAAFLVTVFFAVVFFAADIMCCGCLERGRLCLNFELVWCGKFFAGGLYFAHES